MNRITMKSAARLGTAGATALALTAISVGGAGTAFAQTNSSNTASTTINAIVQQAVSTGHFSGTVLVEKHGTVLIDKAYGDSNLGHKTPNTTETRFAIGAVTQTFVAAAVVQLAETGKINLNSPVGKYLPGSNAAGNYITVRELLTQTSGAPVSPTSQPAQPGTIFQYSPLNYAMLGTIVHNVTGDSIESYIQKNILTPLGLTNTGFIASNMSSVPGSATGYTEDANGNKSVIVFQPGSLSGAIGMYSTTGDLYKWDQALYSTKILSVAGIQAMFTPDPISVKTLKSTGYGFGWLLSLDGSAAVAKATENGFRALVDRDRANDETVILLSNEQWSPLESITSQIMGVLSNTQMYTAPLANTVGGEKEIIVGSKTLSKPFSRIAQGTTYMPIWYIGKALESVNIKQTWDGNQKVWNLTLPSSYKADFSQIPLGTGNTDIIVNGMLVKRINTYAWPDPSTGNKSDTVYAPIFYIQQILQDAGITNHWNGTAWSAGN